MGERIEKMEKEQMKNTEKANAKNKRIQKALERNLFGPNGIETIKKIKLSNIDDERGFLEWELNKMARETKKNALLAEHENIDTAKDDRSSQQLADFRGIRSIEDYERD